MANKKRGKKPRRASDKPERATRRRAKAPGPIEQPLPASGQRLPEQRDAQKLAFITAFAQLGTILHAAAAAQVSRGTVYDWLKVDAGFKADFDQARDDFVDSLEREAYRRAAEGWDEPVFGTTTEVINVDGKPKAVTVTAQVGGVHKYSDKLMEVLLRGNRREKYNIRQHELTGKDGGPLVLEPGKLSDQQLQQIVEILMAATENKQP
jgi:hypothetical protein